MRFWQAIFLLFLVSCKVGKKTASSPSAGPEKVKALQTEFQSWPSPWWTAKGKLTLNMGGNRFPVNISLRAEEGKVIWFSASAFGLLEVGRGRIDGDSVRILDKINNRCIRTDLKGLGNYFPATSGLRQLQHFLMGRVFWDSLESSQSSLKTDTTLISGRQGSVTYKAKLYRKFQLLEAQAGLDEGIRIQLSNQDFRTISGFPVAFQKELMSHQEQNGKITENGLKIEFSRFEFVQQAPDFDFSLPPDCQPMELK